MAKVFISLAVRQLVAERAQWCCEYCKSQERFAPQPFVIDHIIPSSKGGSDEPTNLARSCQGCNGFKFDKTTGYDVVSKMQVSLFNPRIEIWNEHFAWDEKFTNILGTTPTGRATVETLKLNRPQLKFLREFLALHGNHPPIEQ